MAGLRFQFGNHDQAGEFGVVWAECERCHFTIGVPGVRDVEEAKETLSVQGWKFSPMGDLPKCNACVDLMKPPSPSQ